MVIRKYETDSTSIDDPYRNSGSNTYKTALKPKLESKSVPKLEGNPIRKLSVSSLTKHDSLKKPTVRKLNILKP